jgi:hypothetical protein
LITFTIADFIFVLFVIIAITVMIQLTLEKSIESDDELVWIPHEHEKSPQVDDEGADGEGEMENEMIHFEMAGNPNGLTKSNCDVNGVTTNETKGQFPHEKSRGIGFPDFPCLHIERQHISLFPYRN